jgi:hypothetical protein
MKLRVGNRGTYLATGFLILLIAAYVSLSPPLLAAYAALAGLVLLFRFRALSQLNLRERGAALVLVSCLTAVLPLSVLRNELALMHYFVALVGMGCAIVFTRNLETYLLASRLSLLAAQAALAIFLLSRGITSFPLEGLFEHSSSNGITSCLIVLQVNYSAIQYLVRRKSSLITALLTLAICIIGYGRGSILASSAIVATNLLFSASWRSYRAAAGALCVLAVGAVLLLAYGRDVVLFVQENTKIGAGLYDEARARMISEYTGRIHAGTLMAGADYRGTVIESEFGGNPHNSYIRAHHLFGLPYILAMILLPCLMVSRGHSFPAVAFTGCMIFILFVRCATEPILFPTPFDFYYFAICFALSRAQSTPVTSPAGQRRQEIAGGGAVSA